MSFFKSEIVQQDLEEIFQTYQFIAHMSANLPDMDHHDRIQHINDTKALVEKQKLFYTRLCLAASEDVEALQMRERIDALTQAFGYANLNECVEGMLTILNDAMKKELEENS